MPETGQIQILTFGGLKLVQCRSTADDLVVSDFVSKRGRTMLCRLIFASRPVPRTVISEFLWPDEFEDVKQKRLRTELHRLKSLGPAIESILEINREFVNIRRDVCAVDANEFERLIRRADQADSAEVRLTYLQRALTIAEHEWLPHETDDWFTAARNRLRQIKASALILASETSEAMADINLTLKFAETGALFAPENTANAERLVKVLAKRGEVPQAMFAFNRHRDHLHKHFDAVPDDRLVRLIDEIRSQNRVVATAIPLPPDNAIALPALPKPVMPVFGRDQDIVRIRDWFFEEKTTRSRFVSIIGPPGIGKTTLSQAAASSLASEFDGKVAFIDLRPANDGSQMLQLISENLFPGGTGDPLPKIRRAFGTDPILLVLDNLEQIDDAAESVERLLDELPLACLLTTSRRPIQSPRELRFVLEPLAFDNDGSGYDRAAVQLFMEHFRLRRPDFQPTDSARTAIFRLVSRLNGHPLAIVLAASRGHIYSPEEMVIELDHGVDWIRSDSTFTKAEHRALVVAFGGTFAQLSSQTIKDFSDLSHFEGEWKLSDARELCGTRVVDSIAELVDYALVRRFERNGESRYSIVLVFREFLSHRPTNSDSMERFAFWFLDRLNQAFEVYDSQLTAYLSKIDAIALNFDKVFAWCCQNRPEFATEMVAKMYSYWYSKAKGRHFLNVAETWFNQNPGQDPPGAARWVAEGRCGLAMLHVQLGNYSASLEEARRSTQIFESLNNASGVLSVMRAQVHAAYYQFRFADVLRMCDDAIGRAKEIGDDLRWYSFRANRALALANLGRGCEALEQFQELIDEWKRAKNLLRVLSTRIQYGTVLISLREWKAAEAELNSIIDDAHGIDHAYLRARCLLHLSSISIRTGDVAMAKSRLTAAVKQFGIESDAFVDSIRNYVGCLIAVKESDSAAALECAHAVIDAWYRTDAELAVLPAVDLMAYVVGTFGDKTIAKQLLDSTAAIRERNHIDESPHYTCTLEDARAATEGATLHPNSAPILAVSLLVDAARRVGKATRLRLTFGKD